MASSEGKGGGVCISFIVTGLIFFFVLKPNGIPSAVAKQRINCQHVLLWLNKKSAFSLRVSCAGIVSHNHISAIYRS